MPSSASRCPGRAGLTPHLALCEDNSIDLIKVKEGRKKLGEWVGLAEYQKDGTIKNVDGKEKIVGCSCVVVKDFGEQSKALEMLLS
eukprot:gene9777-1761_t